MFLKIVSLAPVSKVKFPGDPEANLNNDKNKMVNKHGENM